MPLVRKRQAVSTIRESRTLALTSKPPQDLSDNDEGGDGASELRPSQPTISYAEDDAVAGDRAGSDASNVSQLVKKLVRFALACEYARQPIRRADINAKGILTMPSPVRTQSGTWQRY